MADDNKLIIEIDADTGQAKLKLGDLKTTLGGLGNDGKNALTGISGAMIAFNQALDLGEKLVSGLKFALDSIEKSEAIDNQRASVIALASSVGLSTEKVDLLLQTMDTASRGTLTTAEATRTAFRMLHSDVTANNIPALVDLARILSVTRPEIGGISNALEMMNEALERGGSRSLALFMDGMRITGSHTQILNALLDQHKKLIGETGTEYQEFGKKVTTSLADSADKGWSKFGSVAKQVLVNIFGDEADKATGKLIRIKNELNDLHQIDKGNDPAVTERINKLLKEQADLKGVITKHSQDETTSLEKNEKILEKAQTGRVKRAYSVVEQQRIAADLNKKLYETLESDEDYYVKHSEQVEAGLLQAKKQFITQQAQEELKNLNASTKRGAAYANEYLRIERNKVMELEKLNKLNENQQAMSARNISAGWNQAIRQIGNEWGSWSKTMQKIGVQTHSTIASSITKMAREHKFAMDEMLNNFLSMIGETLIQKGTADLLMSLFPLNPPGVGQAGIGIATAEIAMGAALVGASGGGAAASGTTGGAIGADIGNQQNLTAPNSNQMQKSAQIVINGDFLNSSETANHLSEIIRKNSDITDFAIVAQGKQF